MKQTGPTITWETLHNELLGFVYNKVRDKPAAEDIVQDVFIKVHTRSGQLREADKITAWIYRITRNAIADHFRNAARSIEPVNMDWESEADGLNACVARCLKALMATLPDPYRVALELAELHDVSQLEVAQRLNISYAGARSRVQRARRMLKEKLETLYLVKTDPYGNVVMCEHRGACACDEGGG